MAAPRSSSAEQDSILLLLRSGQTNLFEGNNCLCSEVLQELRPRLPRCPLNPDKSYKTRPAGKHREMENDSRNFPMYNHHNVV